MVKTPHDYALQQSYQNALNAETVIRYQLPEGSQVTLEICDTLGERIRTLVNGRQPAGYYSASWNGMDEYNRPVTSGAYLYSLKAGDFVQVRKMTLIR